jgi:hypothetical protein
MPRVVTVREGGLEELVANVLPDNIPMLRVFERSNPAVRMKRRRGVAQITLRLS